MKIQYLGTGAAEGIPAMFCQCKVCQKAKKMGGPFVRTRSQSLVNDTILIDFPGDTYWHMVQNGLSLTDYHHCLITHVHDDHFNPGQFEYIRHAYAPVVPEGYEGLTVYGSEDIVEPLAMTCTNSSKRLRTHPVNPYEPFRVADFTVTALKARHGTPHPYNYLLQHDSGKNLLYAHDTGRFLEETWDYLREHPVRFDLVSLDCTFTNTTLGEESHHMGMGDNLIMRDKLIASGCADWKTVFVINHFTHNGPDSDYETFLPIAQKEGFVVTHDGMIVEF